MKKQIFLILTQEHFLFLAFGEKGRDRGREREKHWWLASCMHTDWEGRTCNLGMCPGWELNPQPFGYGTTLPPTHNLLIMRWCSNQLSQPTSQGEKIFNVSIFQVIIGTYLDYFFVVILDLNSVPPHPHTPNFGNWTSRGHLATMSWRHFWLS